MNTQEPKYKAVVNWVLDNLNSGELKAGARLPSENQLSENFGLSRQTVRHAIDILERQKLVTRVRGSGTYIGEAGRGQGRETCYMNIAVISTYTDSYIFPPVLKGIERVLSKHGYTTQIAFTGNKVDREREILSKLIDKDIIDGLIVEPAKSALPNPNLHFYKELMDRQVPILYFNSAYTELPLPCVALNDAEVGKKAVEYLVQAGHQKIAGLFKCDDGQGHRRYAGFVQGMYEAGLKPDDRNIIWMDTEAGKEMNRWADYLFHRLEGCTALVCYNDEAAYVFSGLCQKRGMSIPDQISIISIDNSDLSTMGEVPITSFPHPMEALGRKAAENMVKMIENPYFDGNYRFASQVIERGSVKRLNGGGK